MSLSMEERKFVNLCGTVAIIPCVKYSDLVRFDTGDIVEYRPSPNYYKINKNTSFGKAYLGLIVHFY